MTSISNIWKQLTSILSNLNNFHSLEVVDRVSETQLQLVQVGENSDLTIWRFKGWSSYFWWSIHRTSTWNLPLAMQLTSCRDKPLSPLFIHWPKTSTQYRSISKPTSKRWTLSGPALSRWIAYLSGSVLIKDGNGTLCPHFPSLKQSQKVVKTYFSNNLLFIILALQNSNNLSYCLIFYTTKRDYSRYLFVLLAVGSVMCV